MPRKKMIDIVMWDGGEIRVCNGDFVKLGKNNRLEKRI